MSASTDSHSFRRLLNRPGGAYRDYVLSASRFAGLLEFLRAQLPDDSFEDALDIGCGAGVVSRGLAEAFKRVIGVDQNPDNVSLAQSIADEHEVRNVEFRSGTAQSLPVESGSMDLAVLNGVLEWVGLNNEGRNPNAIQQQVLGEMFRVVRPGGWLYVGIENRWYPRTLLRDPHVGLPLVDALPRPLANVLSKAISKRPFQAYIYGHRKLRRMILGAGFSEVSVFSPFTGYQFPLLYIPIRPRAEALRTIAAINESQLIEALRTAGRTNDASVVIARLRRRARWGMLGLLTHDFAFLCKK